MPIVVSPLAQQLCVDPDRTVQPFVNLLGNAIKFPPLAAESPSEPRRAGDRSSRLCGGAGLALPGQKPNFSFPTTLQAT